MCAWSLYIFIFFGCCGFYKTNLFSITILIESACCIFAKPFRFKIVNTQIHTAYIILTFICKSRRICWNINFEINKRRICSSRREKVMCIFDDLIDICMRWTFIIMDKLSEIEKKQQQQHLNHFGNINWFEMKNICENQCTILRVICFGSHFPLYYRSYIEQMCQMFVCVRLWASLNLTSWHCYAGE